MYSEGKIEELMEFCSSKMTISAVSLKIYINISGFTYVVEGKLIGHHII